MLIGLAVHLTDIDKSASKDHKVTVSKAGGLIFMIFGESLHLLSDRLTIMPNQAASHLKGQLIQDLVIDLLSQRMLKGNVPTKA